MSSAHSAYNSRWRKRSRQYLREHPFCEDEMCSSLATQVHHIDGRGPRGDNSDANLMALCQTHHSRITAIDHGLGVRAPRQRPLEQHPGFTTTP